MTYSQRLGLTRILFFTMMLYLMASRDYFWGWALVPEEFWYPTGVFSWFSEPPITTPILKVFVYSWRLSFIPVILGLGYRYFGPINAILGFLIVNFAHSYGYQTHTYMPLILASLPLAFSPAADSMSLEKYLWKKKPQHNEEIYKRTIFNLKLVFCVVFFCAGLSKVINGGWQWVAGDTLRNYFVNASVIYTDINFLARQTALNLKLYDWPLLCNILAAMAILIECAAPLALWRSRLAAIIVPSLFVMQTFIYFTIYVNFSYYLGLYLVWLPDLLFRKKKT